MSLITNNRVGSISCEIRTQNNKEMCIIYISLHTLYEPCMKMKCRKFLLGLLPNDCTKLHFTVLIFHVFLIVRKDLFIMKMTKNYDLITIHCCSLIHKKVDGKCASQFRFLSIDGQVFSIIRSSEFKNSLIDGAERQKT